MYSFALWESFLVRLLNLVLSVWKYSLGFLRLKITFSVNSTPEILDGKVHQMFAWALNAILAQIWFMKPIWILLISWLDMDCTSQKTKISPVVYENRRKLLLLSCSKDSFRVLNT